MDSRYKEKPKVSTVSPFLDCYLLAPCFKIHSISWGRHPLPSFARCSLQ